MVAHARFPIRAAHLFEQRRGGRVVADVVEGLDLRVAFHVRLPGEDEDFERLRVRRQGEGEERDEDGEMFHKFVFGDTV